MDVGLGGEGLMLTSPVFQSKQSPQQNAGSEQTPVSSFPHGKASRACVSRKPLCDDACKTNGFLWHHKARLFIFKSALFNIQY